MDIETAILGHLLASAPVAAIIGTRGYQLRLPQSPVLPALRVQLIDETEDYVLIGLTNLFLARVQVDLWTAEASATDPYATARAGGVAVRNRLAIALYGGQRFQAGGSPPAFAISSVKTLDKTVEYEPDELRMIRLRQDFAVMYRELS